MLKFGRDLGAQVLLHFCSWSQEHRGIGVFIYAVFLVDLNPCACCAFVNIFLAGRKGKWEMIWTPLSDEYLSASGISVSLCPHCTDVCTDPGRGFQNKRLVQLLLNKAALQTTYISITVHSFFINIFSCIATSNKHSFVWNFDICDLVVQMIKGSGPQNILSNLTGKIKRNTRSDAGRGSKQDVVCVTVSASLGGLCVAPIWWQTVLRMTPWEFPGN